MPGTSGRSSTYRACPVTLSRASTRGSSTQAVADGASGSGRSGTATIWHSPQKLPTEPDIPDLSPWLTPSMDRPPSGPVPSRREREVGDVADLDVVRELPARAGVGDRAPDRLLAIGAVDGEGDSILGLVVRGETILLVQLLPLGHDSSARRALGLHELDGPLDGAREALDRLRPLGDRGLGDDHAGVAGRWQVGRRAGDGKARLARQNRLGRADDRRTNAVRRHRGVPHAGRAQADELDAARIAAQLADHVARHKLIVPAEARDANALALQLPDRPDVGGEYQIVEETRAVAHRQAHGQPGARRANARAAGVHVVDLARDQAREQRVAAHVQQLGLEARLAIEALHLSDAVGQVGPAGAG